MIRSAARFATFAFFGSTVAFLIAPGCVSPTSSEEEVCPTTSAASSGAGGSGGDGGAGGAAACGKVVHAVIRDFKPNHPDFEHFEGELKGIVKSDLGSDGKPVYAHSGATAVTTSPERFNQWYRDVEGVNQSFPFALAFTRESSGKLVYDAPSFFPIDGKGFGNYTSSPCGGHNYHFTTEIHSTFTYKGGEVFTFRGDDDVWVFVNKRLVVDLGGVHGAKSESVDFDQRAAELGIAPGNDYPLDVFHAERHTSGSSFRIETTIECLVPVDPQPSLSEGCKALNDRKDSLGDGKASVSVPGPFNAGEKVTVHATYLGMAQGMTPYTLTATWKGMPDTTILDAVNMDTTSMSVAAPSGVTSLDLACAADCHVGWDVTYTCE